MGKRDPVVRDTRQRILDAATTVFGERGYDGASIDDIAAAAGVTKGAVYYWFTDKSDLARDVRQELWHRLAQDALAAFSPDRPTLDNVLICFEAFVDELQQMPGAQTFIREAWFAPELEVAARSDQETGVELVRDLLRVGVERGDIVNVDPDALARVVLGALVEATLHVLTTGKRAEVVAVLERLIHGLVVTPARP